MLSALSAISARPRQSWFVPLCSLAALFVGLSEPALAQCSGPASNTTCAPGVNPPAEYTSGINLNTNNTPINVTLDPGVQVFITPNTINNAVGLSSTTAAGTGGSATLIPNNAAVTIDTSGIITQETAAMRIQAGGDAIIGTLANPASGIINVTGTVSTNAIWANVFSSVPGAVASVVYSGPAAGPGITVSAGANSTIIQACANDGCGFGNVVDGNAIINAAGNLTGSGGFNMFGLDAVAGGKGTATVNYDRGTIDLTGGGFSTGIFASGAAGATITTGSGTTVIVSSASAAPAGVEAFSDSGATLAKVASTILINGNPAVPTTNYKSNSTGIQVQSDLSGPAEVDYTGPGITVQGGGGLGIVTVAGSPGSGSASGSATVDASGATGPIIADGSNAVGILADSGFIRNVFSSGGRSPTTITGSVDVAASNVSALGQFGTAISATGGSGGVTVNTTGSIMGGWQADTTGTGSVYGLPAAGVILGSSAGAAILTNNGSIGALSDRAVASPLPSFFANPTSSFATSNNTSIINNGTITGFVQLVGGNNSIVNNGTFNLRHFAESTGNADGTATGVRDTIRVAVANLGGGPNNTFANNGTLALPPVTGATKLQSGGQYLPVANTSLGNFSNAMALNGPLQGQILGVSTFINSGVIDLRSNPAAGDVLVISGTSSTVNPLSSAASFPGTFVSNGGSLLLDTVLNQGGAATISDTLVVDGTSVGPKGATQMFVRNAGGGGAFTEGDGILVVEVLDQARSAAGVFTLANDVEAGPFDYRLFQGGVGGSNPGDWFLRNVFVTPPITDVSPAPLPPDPLPPTPPPNPLPPNATFPIIGPRLATYGVVQPLARQLGLDILGTLHERAGDTYEPDCVASAPAAETSAVDLPTKKPTALPTKKPRPAPCPLFSPSAWARFFGGTFNDRYQAFADPRADGNFWGFQGGVDLLRGSLIAGHYDRAGLFGAYGNSNANVDGLVTNLAATAYILTQTGSVNLDAWSGGAYWTHVGPRGWYLDTVLQGTSYSGHASTSVSSLPTDGWGFLASLEGGYPIPLWFWPRLVLEPQGQILWQHVGFGQEFDGIGEIGLGSTSGWTGRLGLLAQSTIVTDSGQVWQPYVRANLWQDWGAQAATSFAGGTIAVPLDEGATRLEFAGGGTVKVNANWSAFAQAGYQFAVAPSNVRRNGFTGDIGLRYTW